MLKARIIPTLLYRETSLVKSVCFDPSRRIGAAAQAISVYNLREVDELVFLDIAASAEGRIPDLALIDELADNCFVPFTVGGGIRSIEDVRALLQVGADKVTVNSGFVARPELVREIADSFGRQCVVVSIDARKTDTGHQAYSACGTMPAGLTPAALAALAEDMGAGEILLTSIDRDGTMQGYDSELIAEVVGAVSIPVIANGGAGGYGDMDSALGAGASAVAASSIYHFTEMTPLAAKEHLAARGWPMRL
jgi:cyclase